MGAQLTVRDGQQVNPGDTIAKISREVYKTRDITGGLPRVAELFEARRPKDPAVITEIDGVVRFGEIKRGKREVIVVPENGPERVYEIPVGKHLRVHEGDHVRAGDRLSEGPVNPHDILRIRGPRAVQEYLLNEIQEVYRLQGVKINDKHIGVRPAGGRACGPPRVPGGEPEADPERPHASALGAAAPGDHEGEPYDGVVHLGGVVPGDHPRAHGRGCARRPRRSQGSQGEHHHRPPDSGGQRHPPLSGHRVRGGEGVLRRADPAAHPRGPVPAGGPARRGDGAGRGADRGLSDRPLRGGSRGCAVGARPFAVGGVPGIGRCGLQPRRRHELPPAVPVYGRHRRADQRKHRTYGL
ncbi:MAG: hypothetical protein HYV46_07825 [candidate division NC10 bacterium]|nr:hypothetical protein [candidate division NC10 bacterium]